VLEISTYTTLARGSSFVKIKETKCKIFTDLLNKAINKREKEGGNVIFFSSPAITLLINTISVLKLSHPFSLNFKLLVVLSVCLPISLYFVCLLLLFCVKFQEMNPIFY